MKNLIIGSFALFTILTTVACSDDGNQAAQAYANANNCTVGGVSPQGAAVGTATQAQSAAAAQVPCSLQGGSAAAAAAAASASANSAAGAKQVPNIGTPVVQNAALNAAIQKQSAVVKQQLAALPPESQEVSKSTGTDIARGPAAIEKPESVSEPVASAGEGDASR